MNKNLRPNQQENISRPQAKNTNPLISFHPAIFRWAKGSVMALAVLFSVTLFQMPVKAQTNVSKSAIRIDALDDRFRHELSFVGAEQAVQLCELKPGDTCTIWVSQQNGCNPTVLSKKTGQAGYTFSFVATEACMDFAIKRDPSNTGCSSGNVRFSFERKNGKKKPSLSEKMANLQVSGGYSDQHLIQNVFIGGGCFDVTNVTGVGSPLAKGTFSSGITSIFMDEGVIISTGNINNAPGPNNSNSAGNNLGGPNSHPDLALLAGGNLFDVAGIEFFFKPTVNTINFDYLFASEEYCEFAPPMSSGFNDVFGFFISGPGISGGFQFNGKNIAVLPGSNIAVSINNVNPVTNNAYFIGNQTNCGSTWNMSEIQFDGFTKLLTAVANVIPCETYRIRLMVGDVGDGIYDSAVFLRANSFSAGGTATAQASAVTTGNNVIYESCNDGSLVFTRAGGDINMPLTLNYTILPQSTATPGVDYAPLSGTVTIPPGAASWSVPINVFNDNLVEGTETIIISVTNSCSCSSLNIEIQIKDPPPIIASVGNFSICGGSLVQISPTVSGGIPNHPYTYSWSNGSTTPSLNLAPPSTTTYILTVTDVCGATATASSTVNVSPLPSANISGSAMICPNASGSTASFPVNFTGEGPWQFVVTANGNPLPPITTSSNPYMFTTSLSGTFQLQSVVATQGNCPGIVSGAAVVTVNNLAASATTTQAACGGGGSMTVLPSGGAQPYSYIWSNSGPGQQTTTGLAPGTYVVTVTDAGGCTATVSGTVNSAPPMSAMASSPTGATCSNPYGGSINLTVNGGTQPYLFIWTGGIGNEQNPSGLAGGVYQVTIADALGCTATASALVSENFAPPTALTSAPDLITCGANLVTVLGTGSSNGANMSYQWSGPGIAGLNNFINVQVNTPGLYTLVVTNQANGCTALSNVSVGSDLTPPVAVAAGNQISCATGAVTLSGSGSSTGASFQYNWSGPSIASGGSTLTPTVNGLGTYTLTVTNLQNGCTAIATAQVTFNGDYPTVSIATPAPLTCSSTSVMLDGGASSSGSGYTYQWLNGSTPIAGATAPTVSVNSPGTYQLVVTNTGSGCTSSQTVQVTQNVTAPVVSASAAGQITCTITSVNLTGSVSGNPPNPIYQWTTPNGTILGGTGASSAVAGAPGTYILTVTNQANGCTASASVPVQQDASIPVVSILPANELNCSTSQVQLNASNSSQGSTLAFTWTTQGGNFVSGQNSLTPLVNQPGTYTLTIFDSSNNCESSSNVTVSQDVVAPSIVLPTAPTLNCDVTSITPGAGITNPPASGLTYQWTTATGVISGPGNVLNPTFSAPGTYSLLVTNTLNGCTSQASMTVSQNVTPPTAQVAAPGILSCTIQTLTLNGGGSSTGAGFTYNWTTTGGNISNGANTLNPTITAPGTYSLLVTNTQNGCTNSAQVVVNEDVQLPPANAGTPATLTCDVQQLTLNGSAPSGAQFAYLWTGPGLVSGATSLTPIVNQPGTYTLLVTNLTNQCTATASVAIGQNIAAPLAEAGIGGELSCTVSQFSLNAAGSSTGNNFVYQWTSPNGNILSGATSLNPVVNAPGVYEIMVTNTVNGCTSSDWVEITEDDELPAVNAGVAQPITCSVTQVTLDGSGSASGPEFTYQWTTTNGNIIGGANSLNPVVNAPGIYVLTVTNTSSNCSSLGSVTVQALTAPPTAEAGPSSELTCSQTSLALDGGGSATGANFTYQWTTPNGNILSGANSLNPMVSEPGVYQLLVTNTATGCTNTDQVAITQSTDVPQAVASAPSMLTCAFTSVALNASGTSTGSNFSYQWTTTNGNIISGANTLSPVVNQPGNYQLLVTNTLNGCTQTAQTLVSQNIQNPTAEAGTANMLTCTTQSLTLNGAGSSTGSNFIYQWSTTNGNIVSGTTSLTPSVNQPGAYTLTVTNTSNGCSSTDQVVVAQDSSVPQATIFAPGILTCAITEVVLNASGSSGPNFQYVWTTPNGSIVAGGNTPNPLVNAPGLYQLTVTNTQNGCTKTAQTNVSQNIEKPVANAGAAFVMDCFDEISYLDGSGSSGTSTLLFQWETTAGSIVSGQNTPKPGVNQAGTYLLTVTNSGNGCTATSQVTITRDAPSVVPETLQPPCFGDRGRINLSGVTGGQQPYLYSIDEGRNYLLQPIFNNLEPGRYDIVVQDARGCEFETSVVIEQPNLLNVELEPKVYLTLGESYQILTQVNFPPEEIAQVTWFPSATLSCADCLNPIATPVTTTLYKVKVVTVNGCKDEAPILFRVDKRGGVYVPNAFSPNGDGTNDVFMIYADPKSVVKIKSFLVFNRWGETVHQYYNFSPNNPAYGWDGLHRGEPLNAAVFTWFAVVEFIDGREEMLKGDVTLMK